MMSALSRAVRSSARAARLIPRYATAARRVLPDFLIVGAQKAGTTSLYEYLCEHPSVQPALTKEVHYFDLQFDRGLKWYRAHFPLRSHMAVASSTARPISGEASPYYLFHPLVPQRVADTLPSVKLLVVLRDPVERALSHYFHEVRWGHETREIDEALWSGDDLVAQEALAIAGGLQTRSYVHQHYSYLARGRYAEQLRRWFAVVPQERALVLDFGELERSVEDSLRRVFDFLGLPPRASARYERYNVGEPRTVPAAIRAKLRLEFSTANAELEELLGRSLSWPRS